ncbi:MAG: SDR family NAD(P)-dependent oxidoreductase [Chloroflexi bacterium]|nr:SDR family NAD(P)-dependent oxidoreductase [Chloroflexota bacterium]
MDNLRDLNVVVTGGAGDIGAAMGAEVCRRGATVTLLDRKSPDEASDWVDRVSANGKADYVQVDVTDRSSVESVLAAIDPLDVVVSNAGIVIPVPFLDVTQEQWHQHLDINLTGCFNVGQTAARLMVSRGTRGRIIFTGSWVGDIPWPEDSAYSVSKAGVKMLAKSMARELSSKGILVNVVAPGIVDAGLAAQVMRDDPSFRAQAERVIPLGQLSTPEQVAKATAFLCSEDSDHMTGSVLLVDGGCSLFYWD